jgi:hypothetical protein
MHRMATELRIFNVPPVTPENQRPVPTLHSVVSLEEEGDAAKRAAKLNLRESGFTVRSLNWGPTPAGKPELVAYVTKGA